MSPERPTLTKENPMSHHLSRLITIVSLASIVSLAAAANTFGADRIPVSSVDDPSLSIANRISAVDNVVVAIDGRLQRIIGAYPPGPPVIPVVDSLSATRQALGTIVATVDSRLCTQDAAIGQGDASLADGDVFAGDSSNTGLLNQLSSVRGVLAEANGRLVRIYGAFPPGPPVDEARTALIHVRNDAVAGFEAITARLGDAIHPPSPCFTT
ncbi:MAG: hypothetical protein M3P18_24820 [Actinomycetota bacterium]|nr:hypothetical protein [Actinomycetota bacterium]